MRYLLQIVTSLLIQTILFILLIFCCSMMWVAITVEPLGLSKWMVGSLGAGFPAIIISLLFDHILDPTFSRSEHALRCVLWAFVAGGVISVFSTAALGSAIGGVVGAIIAIIHMHYIENREIGKKELI